MNTIVKRKIEQAIQEDIKNRVKDYENARSEEFEELKEKFEKNPPTKIKTLLIEANKGLKIYTGAREEAKKLGWKIDTSYTTDHKTAETEMMTSWDYATNTSEPKTKELIAHKTETTKKIAELNKLARKFTLKIYAEGEDVESLLKEFEAEITKILK